jgi:hypothetical protein
MPLPFHLDSRTLHSFGLAAIVLGLGFASGCNGIQANKNEAVSSEVYREDLKTESGEPAYITVQHCLISFRGTPTSATRSMEEAQTLAQELFEKAQAGEDFDAMVRKYTDDSPPGIYRMANTGFPADQDNRDPIFPRKGMVAAFGDTGFPLEVGQYGMAEFDQQKSPFGWHIVKRIK